MNAELIKQLTEYADNPGYSHGDYADTMREAAKALAERATQPAQPVIDLGAQSDQAHSWHKVWETLSEVMPGFHNLSGIGTECAVMAIRKLAASAQDQVAAVRAVPEVIEDPITVPRGLIGAACYLIRKHAPDSKLLEKLRAFTLERHEAAPAPQPSQGDTSGLPG